MADDRIANLLAFGSLAPEEPPNAGLARMQLPQDVMPAAPQSFIEMLRNGVARALDQRYAGVMADNDRFQKNPAGHILGNAMLGMQALGPGLPVRLFRGETNLPNSSPLPSWLAEDPAVKSTMAATGRWFTRDPKIAEYYNKTFGDKSGRVSSVDIPAQDLEGYLSANQPQARPFSASGMAGEEYFVPREVANARRPLKR